MIARRVGGSLTASLVLGLLFLVLVQKSGFIARSPGSKGLTYVLRRRRTA